MFFPVVNEVRMSWLRWVHFAGEPRGALEALRKNPGSFGLPGFLVKRIAMPGVCLVERRRIELPTFALRTRRSPS